MVSRGALIRGVALIREVELIRGNTVNYKQRDTMPGMYLQGRTLHCTNRALFPGFNAALL